MAIGGPGETRRAREALEASWRSASKAALFSPLQRSPMDILLGRWTLDHSPAYVALDLLGRIFSPYDLSFGQLNPLTQMLHDTAPAWPLQPHPDIHCPLPAASDSAGTGLRRPRLLGLEEREAGRHRDAVGRRPRKWQRDERQVRARGHDSVALLEDIAPRFVARHLAWVIARRAG